MNRKELVADINVCYQKLIKYVVRDITPDELLIENLKKALKAYSFENEDRFEIMRYRLITRSIVFDLLDPTVFYFCGGMPFFPEETNYFILYESKEKTTLAWYRSDTPVDDIIIKIFQELNYGHQREV